MIATTTVSFTKLRSGDWGIKGDAKFIRSAIDNDATVTVVKRSGEQQIVRPERIIWSGQGAAIASIVADRPQRSRSSRRQRPECTECGAHGPAGMACTECYEGHFA